MKQTEVSDIDLVKKSLIDASFFSEIVARYQQKIYLYIRRITAVSETDAEDLLQEVFLKAWKNLRSYNNDFAFSTWLYRIAHNTTVSQFRKRKIETVDTDFDVLGGQEKVLQNEFDANVTKHQVQTVLAKISYTDREILVLRFIEDKSYEEISDILKKPVGTVSVQIARAKKSFRAMLEKLFPVNITTH